MERNLTTKFIKFRNEVKEEKYSEPEIDMTETKNPAIKIHEHLQKILDKMEEQTEELDTIYRNVFFDSDEKLADKEKNIIKNLEQDYSVCLQMFTKITDNIGKIKDNTEKTIIKNIVKAGMNRANKINTYVRNQQVRRKQILNEEEPDEEYNNYQQMLMMREDVSRELAEHAEIIKLHTSVVNLMKLTQQLATMVDEQGTILDRIDYNIEQSVVHSKKAKEELIKSEKHQSSYVSLRNKLMVLCTATIVGLSTAVGIKYR